ncbi:MAG: glycoside hydrolase 43 family protein [Gammaproteobacteria bacterium]|nr:glycoside hydrolase 43 family protein [Gammaproteobacteria bacterium]
MSSLTRAARRCLTAAVLLGALGIDAAPGIAWTYHNPILYADYSDPDVVRVGSSYYLVASSFHFSPGIPVLQSRDLVHWTIVGHALARLDFAPAYGLPGPLNFTDSVAHPKLDYALGYRYASGVWAPAIRSHRGRLYIYFPTPTEGIFMTSAPRAAGPWTLPVKVIGQARLEDPCPFWDDEGRAYLIHSREGAGPLILHRMSPDGKRVLDAGKVIVDDPVHLPTLEGPKLYKRHGYYYIFAPYGGVDHGSQAVLRARNIYGPYEFRTVLSQGTTQVQGPHQGGYVETPSGQGWFIHFNSTGPYGRIVYLEPVTWKDGWPIIGALQPGATVGQPVASYTAPDVGRVYPAIHPQTSDKFTSGTLGPQWEWNHDPAGDHWSLTERPGFLRLRALPAADLVSARDTLTQLLQAPNEEVTARLAVGGMADHQKAGLAMFGVQPSWIGVVQRGGRRYVEFAKAGAEITGPPALGFVTLRMQVADGRVRYSYSLDGRTFRELGTRADMRFSWWKAARPALFTFNTEAHAARGGIADFDWVRVRLLQSNFALKSK